MATLVRVHCTLCGFDVKPGRLGLTEKGEYDVDGAPQHEMSIRTDVIGGYRKLTVTREPLPMEFAYGLRRALRAALARVEGEIAAGGGESEDNAA